MKKTQLTIFFLAVSIITWAQIPTYKWVSGGQEPREKSTLNSTEPGPRNGHFTFSDSENNLWLFGGAGQDFNADNGFFNDLWKYDRNQKSWSWIDGNETVDLSNPNGGDNNSLTFDGVNDHVIFNQGYPIATVPYEMTDITIEMWFKTTQSGPLLSYGQNTNNAFPEWEVKIENGGQAMVLYRNSNVLAYYEGLNLIDDEWHHLAFVTKEGDDIFIDDLLFIYVDGEFIGQESITSNNPFTAYAEDDPNNFSFLIVGGLFLDGYSEFFKGQIDELRFWDYARTESEIKTNRFRELAFEEEGLTGYYNFNQGEADSPLNNQDFLGSFSGPGGTLINFGRDAYFVGEMAQVRLFSSTKTSEEIIALSQAPVTGSSPDIVNAYSFQEGVASDDNSSISDIDDIASFNYDGELRNFDLTGAQSNYQSDYMKVVPIRYPNFTGGAEHILVDVNNDTYQDIITTNFDDQSISVLINDQAGAFGAATEFEAGAVVYHLTSGLFNNDAFPDVVVTTEGDNPGDKKIRMFFGDGAGGFPSFTDFPLPDDEFPGPIHSADLNGDTFEDWVVLLAGSQSVGIYYGDGMGGYSSSESFPIGSYNKFEVEIDDFTNDGWLDIIVPVQDDFGNPTIGILINNASGSFEDISITLPTGDTGYLYVGEMVSAEINNDGNKDLIFIDEYSYGTLFGNGDGTFYENFRGNIVESTRALSNMEILDVNNDNILDIIASSSASNKLSIFHGDAEGKFTFSASTTIAQSSEFVSAADLDKDGLTDITVSHYAEVSVFLRENNDLNQLNPVNTLDFDGIDDYVNIPQFSQNASDPNIFDNDFTWEGWIKTNDNGPLFSITTDGYDNGWPTGDLNSFALYIANNKLSLNQNNNSDYTVKMSEDYDITDGQWHHVAFSVTSTYPSEVVFYLDGIQLNTNYTAGDNVNTVELNFSSFNVDNFGYAGRLGYVIPSFGSFFLGSTNQALTSNWTEGFDIPAEKPGRAYGFSWTDNDGNFNVFGGLGVNGLYNAIRQFNPGTNEWSFIKGDDTANNLGSYGSLGISDPDNIPPSRRLMGGTKDQDGNVWIFGGSTSDGIGSGMSDLWKYDPTTNEWVWIAGSQIANDEPVYGTKGVSDSANKPGARENHKMWSDNEGNLWLFGGYGVDADINLGYLNDLWKYNIEANEWTWVSGSNLADQKGIFGDLNEYSIDYYPGGRAGYNQWVDVDGIVWIFDGQGYDKFGLSAEYLNDLWSYNPSTNEWAWHSGSNFASSTGSYNEKGLSSTEYVPGARSQSNTWIDDENNLWMFGGNFPNQVTTGQYNDLWKYKPSSNEWTWVSGFNSTAQANEVGFYGNLENGSQPTPGARNGALEWTDLDGNIWIQGGAYIGGNVNGNIKDGYLNDLWKFNISKSTWTYLGGSTEIEITDGQYGSKGIGNVQNVPKDRWHGASWTGKDGKLWFFGGIHFNEDINDIGWLNDLWNYDPESQVYTWVSGSSELNPTGVYGTKGEASVGHIPGPRSSSAYWTDSEGNFYLFGGYESFQQNNDLWKFNPNTLEWTWLSGNSFQNTPGSYGEKGVAAPENLIGARRYMDAQIDSEGIVWIFGGQGYDSQAQYGYLNDLWKYDATTNEWTWVSGLNLRNLPGTFGTKGVASTENIPPPRYGQKTWMDDSDNLWVFGGVGVIEIDGDLFAGYLNDLWKYNTKTNEWTWVDGSPDFNVTPNFGNQGEFSELNVIQRRQRVNTFGPIDKSLWLFGGRTNTSDSFNDLWEIKFNPAIPLVTSPSDIQQHSFTFMSDEAWTREYQVQVDDNDGFGDPFYDNTSPDQEVTINDLLPGTYYYYRVNAINEIGQSGFAQTEIVLTLPETPTFASLEAAISDLTSTQVYLDWEVTEGILNGYYVDISKDPTFSDNEMIHEDFDAKTIDVSQRQEVLNLTPGTRYYARLQSFNASGVSEYSQTVPFLTKPATVIYPEEEITEITQVSAIVNWESVNGIVDNYRISVSTLDDGFIDETQFLANYNNRNIPVDRNSIAVEGLQPGTSYFVVVSAINTSGESEQPLKITILTAPSSPVFDVENSILEITQTDVTFNWEAPAGFFEGYQLEVSLDQSFVNTNLMLEGYGKNNSPFELSQGDLTTTVDGLTPGQTYYARIRAFNGGNIFSPNSNILSFTSIPNAPVFANPSNISQVSASLSWSSPQGAQTFFLDVNSSENFETATAVFENFPTAVSFEVLSGLTPGTTYYVRAESANTSGGSGGIDPPDYGQTSFLTRPMTPELNSSTAITDISQTSITLNWEEVPEVLDGYYIDISTSSNFTQGSYLTGWENQSISKEVSSILVDDLEVGTQYFARLRSYNTTGPSQYSNVLSMLTLPETPTFDSSPVSSIGQSTATLSWNSVSEIYSGYYMELSTDATFEDNNQLVDGYGADNIAKVIEKGQNTEFIDELDAGVQYYARLSSYNTAGASPWSDPISILSTPNTPVLSELESIGQTTASVSWTEILGADNYVIDVSQNFFQTLIPAYNGTQSDVASINLVDLNPGEEHQIRVRSKNASGESPNSALIEFLTAPATPIARDATNSSSRVFTANWDPATGADYYVLEVSSNDFQTLFYNEQVSTSNPIKIEDLISGDTYEYRVKAGNASGESEYSNEISVIAQNTSQSLSISSLEYSDEFGEASTSSIINVKFAGGVGEPTVLLRHREILSTSWSDYIAMNEITPTEFEFTILPNMLDNIGVVFEIIADDGVSLVEEKGNTIKRVFSETESEALPDIELGEWSIVSIPYVLDDNLVTSIFNELGDLTYKKRWRLMTYIDGDFQDQGVGFTRIELGKGYWFNSLNDVKISVGAGQTNSVVPFNMTLQKGWNQIGNPYNVSINWDDILDENNQPINISRLLVYNTPEKEFQEQSSLEAFGGAFVFADDAVDQFLVSPTAGSSINGRVASNSEAISFTGNNWMKSLNLNWRGKSREVAAVGMHSAASTSKDRFDKLVVPRFENYLEMYTSDNDYFYSKFSHDIKPNSKENIWVFNLASNTISGLAELDWDPQLISSGGKLWLVDEESGQIVEMTNENSYSFGMNSNHKFSIHYSEDPNYVVIPTTLNLGNLFPNPVSDKAYIPLMLPKQEKGYDLKINLFDVNGRLVKTIAEGMYNPGIHQFELDIESGSGLKDGIYFYSVSFKENDRSQQKKIIIKR